MAYFGANFVPKFVTHISQNWSILYHGQIKDYILPLLCHKNIPYFVHDLAVHKPWFARGFYLVKLWTLFALQLATK